MVGGREEGRRGKTGGREVLWGYGRFEEVHCPRKRGERALLGTRGWCHLKRVKGTSLSKLRRKNKRLNDKSGELQGRQARWGRPSRIFTLLP